MSHQTILDVVAQSGLNYETYTLLNEANGDQLSLEPDNPSKGWITITAIDQTQGEDSWD